MKFFQQTIIIYLVLFIPYVITFRIFQSDSYGNNLINKTSLLSGCPFAKLGNTINTLVGTACDVLGDVFFNNQPPKWIRDEDLRPEHGFYFEEPNTNSTLPDQRGPCPGLNLLANYGYLPRNGIITFNQTIEAAIRGFNLGIDIATILATIAIVTTGNITTETFSIGGPDQRVGIGNIGGLSRHNCIENDISPNREDLYTGNCDNHHLSSRLFKQNVEFAKKHNGLFNQETMIDQYARNANYSKQNNPYLSYFGLSTIGSLGTYVFYSYLLSNGTYELDGNPDYISISNIIGARLKKTDENDYNFEYIPEQWPEINNTAGKSWYRRKIPLTLLQFLPLLPRIYAANPVGMPFGQLGTSNLTPQTMACSLYLATLQITPILAAQTLQNSVDALTWAISKLDPIFGGTTFGCPANSFNNNGNNNANTTNTTMNCISKANQYYNVYFPVAPK